MMPSFSHISVAERNSIIEFLYNNTAAGKQVVTTQKDVVPYQHTGYNRWYDSEGYPVSTPPWGTLTAIDLNTGKHAGKCHWASIPNLPKKEWHLLVPTTTEAPW